MAFGSDTTTHCHLFIDCGITFRSSSCDGISTSSFYKVNYLSSSSLAWNSVAAALEKTFCLDFACDDSLKTKVFPSTHTRTATMPSNDEEIRKYFLRPRTPWLIQGQTSCCVVSAIHIIVVGLDVCLDLTKKYYVNKQKKRWKIFHGFCSLLLLVHTEHRRRKRKIMRWRKENEELSEFRDESGA